MRYFGSQPVVELLFATRIKIVDASTWCSLVVLKKIRSYFARVVLRLLWFLLKNVFQSILCKKPIKQQRRHLPGDSSRNPAHGPTIHKKVSVIITELLVFLSPPKITSRGAPISIPKHHWTLKTGYFEDPTPPFHWRVQDP